MILRVSLIVQENDKHSRSGDVVHDRVVRHTGATLEKWCLFQTTLTLAEFAGKYTCLVDVLLSGCIRGAITSYGVSSTGGKVDTVANGNTLKEIYQIVHSSALNLQCSTIYIHIHNTCVMNVTL